MVYSIFVTMGPFAKCLINHIAIGGNVVECVNTYKILGLLWTKTLSGIVMPSTFLRKPVKSYVRSKYCIEQGCAKATP